MNSTVRKVNVTRPGRRNDRLGYVTLHPVPSHWGRQWEVHDMNGDHLGAIIRYEHTPTAPIPGTRQIKYLAPRISWVSERPNGNRISAISTRNDAIAHLIIKD